MSSPSQVGGAIALVPRPVQRPWGGQRLAPSLGWSAPKTSEPVGEWWLLSTYGSEVSRLSLDDMPLTTWLDGASAPGGLPDAATFPLLLKFLDTEQVLSVQVHPDDAVARKQSLPNGKTEAWHVLSAEPGACLFVGPADGVSPTDVLDAAARGVSKAQMAECLRRVPAVAGQTWLVEAGTIHAVGPGVTLFEIQQTSDATWRIYDWERTPVRPLHLSEARAAARDTEPGPSPGGGDGRAGWHKLVSCDAFALHRATLDAELALPEGGAWGAVTVLSGSGQLCCGATTVALSPGVTALSWGQGSVSGQGLTVLLSQPGAR